MTGRITATIKPGREKPVAAGHPWVFSGAVSNWSQPARAGQTVDVISSSGEWIARGLANPDGNLAIRLYSRNRQEELDAAFFCGKLSAAIDWREKVVMPAECDTDSFRLCFSESDGLSGLIVDRYADIAVMQVGTPMLDPFIPALEEMLRARNLQPVVTRDDEGGARSPDAPTPAASAKPPHLIRESGFSYQVDLASGQKTGFYLDQRVNRRRVAAYAKDRRCLSAYCYTGGFELHLAHAGAASITGIDRSNAAIDQARANHALNPGGTAADYMVADVPDSLRKFRDSRTTFDLIVLDPPKFVSNQGQLEKGLRAYKDINLLAMKLLTPGGILATFSCSGWVKTDEFRMALSWAAQDARREIQILEHLTQPPDHPILLPFPESDYLCGYILQTV